MAITTQRGDRRAQALTKERIVQAAIEILDLGGETALTFRALAARLATGSGAIYWHVADKNALLATATEDVITHALTDVAGDREPRAAIRAITLSVFDAIHAHPWVGAQLSQEPWQTAVLRVFDRLGQQVQGLGVPERARFDCASALLNYVSGLAGQYAAGARLKQRASSRADFLATIAAGWEQLDAVEFPFLRQVAPQLADHDDREQFLAGIDLIVAGIDRIIAKIDGVQ